MKYSVLLGSGILGLGSAFACAASAPLDYPETKKIDVVDVYHGVEVPDPYRWLEADVRESEEVAAWVEAQNEVTFGVLEQIPYRDAIRERLMEKLDYERYGSPFINAGRYYFTKNDGLQNHSVLYTTGESLDGEARVVIDPNTFSEDGTTALAGTFFSPDGRYMAYFVQEGGSDWRTGFVRDLETGEDLDDRLEWIKFSGASWKRDGSGFFYSRYPEPGEGEAFTGRNTNHMVYFHRIGTDQSEDVLVYENRDQPEYNFYSSATEDGRYLVIGVSKATSKNMILYKDLSEPLGYPVTLIGDFENDHSFVGNDGPIFYFVTNYEAANGRLVAVDIRDPSKNNWETVIPETESVLTGVNFVGNQFVASYLEDASTRVRMYRPDGSFVRSVELPGIGTASGFGGERTDSTTFYSFSSYATPPSIYAYDLITGESTLFKRAGVDFNPDDYVVEQKFYTSKDGTRVPMFITRPKALRLDGQNPVLLYGYGGFDVSLTPSFSTTRAAWLEMGGVYVVANLRGGGEYGQAWYKAGTKLQKQNVFDDFIAAAEYLIDNRYTSPEKLAIQGGSNGGLLVGAAMTQRPELFAVALPAVGVLDMLRYHLFTIGRAWSNDYGLSENQDEFMAQYAYSPLHNTVRGTEYPATLITTADYDDRVVPAHSFKFAAALQAAHDPRSENPVLIRIETGAGHGAGKPISKVIEEYADVYSFVARYLNMDLPEKYRRP
ncbi:MAG: prolyl oligopeptidase family protein [Phycisphaerales bacterium]